ncbi:MAG: fluoride efflux transporter FluC [Ilumatobacteraceae bacterium]
MQVLFVAIAGAVGALCRWQLGSLFPSRGFPWATLGINLSGTFTLAFVLSGPLASRLNESSLTAITIGLLGSYTTFSTFGQETFTLLRTERIALAVAYALVSLVGGVTFAALGYLAGRQLA